MTQRAWCPFCESMRPITKAQYNRPIPYIEMALVARVWLGCKHETTIVMSYPNFGNVGR